MPIPPTELICTLRLPGKDQHNPAIHLAVGSEPIACIDTGEPDPHIPLPDASVNSVLALDILEHVHDEQTWLAEFARILKPTGDLRLRVPLENTLAWLDALNMYRYVSDTVGLGAKPKETMPLGWHRHYTRHDLVSIVRLAGFETVSTHQEGIPLSELPHLAGLLLGNILLQRPTTEATLFDVRSRRGRGPRLPLPTPLAACITVHAKRIHQGFDPDPALDQSDRPEELATIPLE